jgi:hypothetical protein
MRSDKDKIYMKYIYFEEIYNFVVDRFSLEAVSVPKNLYNV